MEITFYQHSSHMGGMHIETLYRLLLWTLQCSGMSTLGSAETRSNLLDKPTACSPKGTWTWFTAKECFGTMTMELHIHRTIHARLKELSYQTQ